VLDEAQAIKNPSTRAAKATRLLDSRHRLALTGTPVENHLGDLWAIMELVNPGLLGPRRTHAAWAKASRANGTNGRGGTNGREARDGDAFRERVARMVRPILLRRHRAEVLDQLPEHPGKTLLGDLEDVEKIGDPDSRVTANEVDDPVVGAAKAEVGQDFIRIGDEIAIGEEQQFDQLDHLAIIRRGRRLAGAGLQGRPGF